MVLIRDNVEREVFSEAEIMALEKLGFVKLPPKFEKTDENESLPEKRPPRRKEA